MPAHADPLSPRYIAALTTAAELHRTQVRKQTGIPYLTHLMTVSSLVFEAGGTEDEAIAGLLHDAVEDAGGLDTLAMIRAMFGERVAGIVAACSDSGLDGQAGAVKAPWWDRKRVHLAHLAAETDRGVLLVVLADKVHNARTVVADLHTFGVSVFDRFSTGATGTAWYYTQMAAVLTAQLGELALVVELRELAARISTAADTAA